MTNKYYISIILARKGSKQIKTKNLIKIKGKPLIFWSIKAALKSKKIKKVFVSSDDKKILKVASHFGAETILRPKELATDTSSSESGWLHAAKEIEKKIYFDSIVVLQATSPIRSKTDIDEAIKKFEKEKADSLFSSYKTFDTNLWEIKNKILRPNYNYLKRKPRQKNNPKYLENGSFYIFDKKKFFKKKNRLFEKKIFYEQSLKCSFQLDSYEDLEIIKKIM